MKNIVFGDFTFAGKKPRAFRLSAIPSLVEGAGRVLDLGATMQVFNREATEAEADYYSLLSDWQAVGDDLNISAQQYGQKQTAS